MPSEAGLLWDLLGGQEVRLEADLLWAALLLLLLRDSRENLGAKVPDGRFSGLSVSSLERRD